MLVSEPLSADIVSLLWLQTPFTLQSTEGCVGKGASSYWEPTPVNKRIQREESEMSQFKSLQKDLSDMEYAHTNWLNSQINT